MPLYEYSCHDCFTEFELLVRGSEEPHCPKCDSHRLAKLLSAPAAHSGSVRELPTCGPSPTAGCGLPQCGSGRCQFE